MTETDQMIRTRVVATVRYAALNTVGTVGYAIGAVTDRYLIASIFLALLAGTGTFGVTMLLRGAWQLHRTPAHVRYMYSVSQLGKDT